MLKVGVTGGIGSGKSLVCDIFRKWDIPIYTADLEAKKIINSDPEVTDKIKKAFGGQTYNNGRLDREKMSQIVFNNEKALSKLNSIVHPAVRKHFIAWAENQKSTYVMEEAAILFESGGHEVMDKTIMVYCDKKTRMERTVKRNGYSPDKIERIMANQMDEDKKRGKADFVVMNDEKTLLLPQLLEIHQKILALR